jgi:hypothetical protein
VSQQGENAGNRAMFRHVVLTRFWFRISAIGRDSGPRPDPAWFENRLNLFKTYCLPSVVAQSVQNFTWFIYFDACTPDEYLDRMRELIAPYGNIRVRTSPSYDGSLLARDSIAEIEDASEWLLTTRLDSDDGWHRDFVKRLQASVQQQKREFLNFPAGIIAYRNKVFLYRHRSNAFISLLEPIANATTVCCGPHEELSRLAPIRQLDPTPAFVQVVHGTNLSNKPRGARVHKAIALQGFEAIPALFAPPFEESDTGILFENATSALAWRIRDKVLDLAKGIVRAARNKRS